MSATQRPAWEERRINDTNHPSNQLRNPSTGEEKTIYGNYSAFREAKAGFAESIESSLTRYEMDDETFIKYATAK